MIIAQLSDPHIVADDNLAVADDPATHFQRAVEHLLRLPAQPDIVLVTGDCTNNGALVEYERFQELLRPLTMPVYVIPGNHDNRQHLLAVFGPQGDSPLAGYVQYVVEGWPVRLVALDTNLPGQSQGALDGGRLEWLDDRLAERPTEPTLIFMHHPPFRTGLAVADGIGLLQAEAFGEVIARHPQVERIVAGHLHITMQQRFHGTVAMTCPAAGYAMLPDLHHPERLSVVMEPPSCLLHVWSESGGLASYTSVIGDHGPVVTVHDGKNWVA